MTLYPAWRTHQRIGINWDKCINFDQATSVVSYTQPSGIDNVTDFTLAVSFYARTIDSLTRRIIEVGNGYQLILNNSSLQAQVGHATTNAQANTLPGAIKPWQWYRVVVTFINSDNFPKLYANAVKSTGTNVNKSGSRLSPAGQAAYIGNRAALDRNFDGFIDELMWYSKAWSEDEIIEDYYKFLRPTDNQVFYFPMNETSGNLVDSVGGAEGTPSNVTQGATSFTTGTRSTIGTNLQHRLPALNIAAEKSLYFNGVSTYATSPVVPATTGFCLALWYQTNTAAVNQRLVDWESTFDRNGFNLRINTNTGLPAIIIANASTTTVVLTASATQVRKGREWNHVAVTFKLNQCKFYVNGLLIGTDTGCDMTSNVNPITLGRRAFGSAEFLNGHMKDFIFVNTTTPWTLDEVYNIYYRRVTPTVNAFNKLNDDATDATGNGNTLTINNGLYSVMTPPQFGTKTAIYP